MAQSQPKNPDVNHILKLVDQLSPDDQEQVIEQMKLQWLRRELAKAEESLARGEGIPAEEVFRQMRERNAAFRKKENQ